VRSVYFLSRFNYFAPSPARIMSVPQGYTHVPNLDLACNFTKMELYPLFTPGSGSLFQPAPEGSSCQRFRLQKRALLMFYSYIFIEDMSLKTCLMCNRFY
jgi:hypothetical protein